ncbi:metallophosphoesterase [Maricaulis sp. CAU 1757]
MGMAHPVLKDPQHAPDMYIDDTGPFDMIGDVHGCAGELEDLLEKLGYEVGHRGPTGHRHYEITPPDGRKAVFLGDLVDRGPRSPDVLRLVMEMVGDGEAYCVAGNHDDKYRRWLNGNPVEISHGLEDTLEQAAVQPEGLRHHVRDFLNDLPTHLILDKGRLVVAHAGLREDLQGRETRQARTFALYGERTGERDQYGYPVRGNWAKDYAGQATVVHGHVAAPEVREENNVICIDTGCVYGGHLTAYRWPERELVQVEAHRRHYRSKKWGKR